jgi:SAM-dependent methyltransferase
MKEITNCEVCGNKDLKRVLNLGLHPLCDNLIPIGSKDVCREYPIEICFCEKCRTAHQMFQVPKTDLFEDSYHYRARMTGSVLTGMKDLVDNCEKRLGILEGKSILDVGCNDGSLLDFFQEKGCKTIGIEPTDAALESKHNTLKDYFGKESASKVLSEVGHPDIITFTNVFAHIENLPDLIDSLKLLIGKETVVVIENHYLGTVLKTDQFDTFYHEHARTYSVESFKYISKDLGLNLQDVEFVSRYGGNIRAYLGHNDPLDINVDESDFTKLFNIMNGNLVLWKNEIVKYIEDLVSKKGPLLAKAFPGRAAIIIKYLDLNETHFSAIYEIKGSIKVGYYAPGTRIPILPESELYVNNKQSDPIINLAWHIPKEVQDNLLSNGYTGEMINIKEMKP